MRTLILTSMTMVLITTAHAQDTSLPGAIEQKLYADAKKCSAAAVKTYALSNAEPAEKVAEMAFEKCSEEWRKATDWTEKGMQKEIQVARDDCVKKLGEAACPTPVPFNIRLMNAARRTFVHNAAIEVFDIRASAAARH
jgi:hypothetical protein